MRVHEAIASGAVKFAKVQSKNNYANGLTKPLPPIKHHQCFHDYLFWLLLTHCDEEMQPFLTPFCHQQSKTKKVQN